MGGVSVAVAPAAVVVADVGGATLGNGNAGKAAVESLSAMSEGEGACGVMPEPAGFKRFGAAGLLTVAAPSYCGRFCGGGL